MPRKKKDSSIAPAATGTTDAPSVPKRTIIRAKSTTEWSRLLKKAEEGAWRKLRVIIQLREWLMAGKPASLDAANAMLKARGLEDQMEAVADRCDAATSHRFSSRITATSLAGPSHCELSTDAMRSPRFLARLRRPETVILNPHAPRAPSL